MIFKQVLYNTTSNNRMKNEVSIMYHERENKA